MDVPVKTEGQRVWVDPDAKTPKGITPNREIRERAQPKPHDCRRRHVKGFNRELP